MTEYFDVAAVRKEFAVTKRMLYFDSAHQTPLAGSVREALHDFYSEGYQNAGPKPVWMRRVEQVRVRVANLLGASSDEIAFTKNTSEGLNIAANAIPLKPGDNVLMIEGDHPNNAYAWLNLRRKGVEVRFTTLKTDWADASTFLPHVDGRTRVISLSHVTFHAGHRHDIASVGELCKRKGIHLVVDAMQSVGVMPVNMDSLGLSILAAGCHKGLFVPQGLGILCVRRSVLDELQPAYLAMASLAEPPDDYIARPDQLALHKSARRFEIGNYNLPDIHALGAALDLVSCIGVENIANHVLDLGNRLIDHMDRQGIRVVGPRQRDYRSHIYVLDLPGEGWLDYLASNQVRVSPERDGIRISFAMFNTADEVDQLAEIIDRRGKQPKRATDTVEQID
jgi:selenocysteine lyase/cysteine desulfurase